MNEKLRFEEVRLKYISHVEMGQSPPSGEYSGVPNIGFPFLQGTTDFGLQHPEPHTYCEAPSKFARVLDILVSVRAPVGELNYADQEYGIGRGLCAVRPSPRFYLSYAWWALHWSRKRLDLVSTGSTYEAVSVEDVNNLFVPLPPLEQQLAIADFLDRETAQIDTLVAEKEQWLSLLAEKRRSLITRAVTRGLNPDAPMRDSGEPWLGAVPAHWQVERSRWLFAERDIRSVTGDEEMLTVSHLTGVTPRSEKNVNMFEAETTVGYKTCSRGDLVINTMWAWMGAMGVAPVNGMVSPAYNVYTPVGRLAPDYIDALVRMPIFAEEVTRFSKGVWSSRLRLYPEDFFQVWLPLPPLAEQSAIVRHIEAETGKLDALRDAAVASIALLRERRAALIAAAVTGKIDVS